MQLEGLADWINWGIVSVLNTNICRYIHHFWKCWTWKVYELWMNEEFLKSENVFILLSMLCLYTLKLNVVKYYSEGRILQNFIPRYVPTWNEVGDKVRTKNMYVHTYLVKKCLILAAKQKRSSCFQNGNVMLLWRVSLLVLELLFWNQEVLISFYGLSHNF